MSYLSEQCFTNVQSEYAMLAQRLVNIEATSNICNRRCAYIVLQSFQRYEVCSVVFGTVHYEEPLTSFDKSRA